MIAEARSRAAYFLAYLADCLVAPRLDPARTLVVSGFWRSGTTWVQELLAAWLGAKTIFEPFHLSVPQTRGLFKSLGVADRPAAYRELFVPYWPPGDAPQAAALRAHYARALKGTLRGRAVRALRDGMAESWRARLVVKLTRGQLSLAAAQREFGFPLLHISRDPRAVVGSVRMTDWAWLFDHLTPADLLLDCEDGRAGRFAGWEREIRAAGKAGLAVRIATYWAVLEHGLLGSGPGERTIRLRYEDVLLEPEAALRPALERIGVRAPQAPPGAAREQPSYSTSAGRSSLSRSQRLYAWRQVLSDQESRTVRDIARHFGLAETLQTDAS